MINLNRSARRAYNRRQKHHNKATFCGVPKQFIVVDGKLKVIKHKPKLIGWNPPYHKEAARFGK